MDLGESMLATYLSGTFAFFAIIFTLYFFFLKMIFIRSLCSQFKREKRIINPQSNTVDGYFSFMPAMLLAATCILWLFYGIAISDTTTIVVNVVGLLISTYALCLLCSILPTDQRSLVLLGLQTFATITFLVFTLWYVQCGTDGNDPMLGMIACGGSLLALGWPLLQYPHGKATAENLDNAFTDNDWKTGSAAVLLRASPELAAFASSLSWAMYGATLHFNMNIVLPNVISALFSIMQLVGRKKGPIVSVDPSASEIPSTTKNIEINPAVGEMHIIQIPDAIEMRPQNIAVGVR